MSARPLVLASASPRRQQLLAQIGIIPAEVMGADIDESPWPGESPDECVQRLARSKALLVGSRRPGAVVLAADTLIACRGRILGKPAGKEEAFAMWQDMAEGWHQVLTAVAVLREDKLQCLLSASEVAFGPLEADGMEAYWASGEPADKAGAYAIQGLAAVWIREIRGSYSGIMGLPLYETAQLLRQAGVDIPV